MNVTGVGSTYHFMYNTKTNKLSTKDGSKNEFVDYCNGDVKGEDTETLNHFDAHTRYQFERMLYVYGTGMLEQDPFANEDEVEITADIESATKTSFYVNGKKTFTAYTGMTYLPSEIKTFGTIQQPFKTRGYKPYDPETNSITIGIGSRFDLGKGYRVTVQEDCVWGEGYGKGSLADDERCNMMVGGLSSLIHFADQQYFSSMTDPYTDYILEFLASQGVDTSREFVINGTHCELVNGKINEVGNDYVVPSSIQQAAVKRYEEKMSELLKDGDWYRRNRDKQQTYQIGGQSFTEKEWNELVKKIDKDIEQIQAEQEECSEEQQTDETLTKEQEYKLFTDVTAAEKALYDLENPLQPFGTGSPEVQKQIEKEKEFYQSFLENLKQS